mgnify:CR=1 FL=1
MSKTPTSAAEWIAAARRRNAENGGPREARASQRAPAPVLVAPRVAPGKVTLLASTKDEQPFHWIQIGTGTPDTLPSGDLKVEPGYQYPDTSRAPPYGTMVGGTRRLGGDLKRGDLQVTVLAYSPCGRWAWVRSGRNWPFTAPAIPHGHKPPSRHERAWHEHA